MLNDELREKYWDAQRMLESDYEYSIQDTTEFFEALDASEISNRHSSVAMMAESIANIAILFDAYMQVDESRLMRIANDIYWQI